MSTIPIHPTRHTAEAMRQDTEAMASEIVKLMATAPGAAQWRAAESLALGILSAVRKGCTAHQLVQAQAQAQAARRVNHETAMVMQLERMGMSETAERLHPIFEGICAPFSRP
jgi:hypothetical protein